VRHEASPLATRPLVAAAGAFFMTAVLMIASISKRD
jgi:hypothetical protein